MPLNLADNYFQLFGIKAAFHVQQEQIVDKHRRLQALLHPDRYAAAASERERRISAQGAAFVNEAYRVLSDDCTRAAYLLQLEELQLNNETETTNDPEFLIEQMQLREQLEDSNDDVEILEQIKQMAQKKITEYGRAFDQAYLAKDLSQARLMLWRMQFVKKLSNDADYNLKQVQSE